MKISDLPKASQDALMKGCTCAPRSMSTVPHTPCDYCKAIKLWKDLSGAPKDTTTTYEFRYGYPAAPARRGPYICDACRRGGTCGCVQPFFDVWC